MEFKETCNECPAHVVCFGNFPRNGVRCRKFHIALEEKLNSTPSAEQQIKDSISICKELVSHIENGAPGDQLTINSINAVVAKLSPLI